MQVVKLAAVVQDSRCTEIDGYDCDHALSQVYVLQSMLLVQNGGHSMMMMPPRLPSRFAVE